MTATLAAVLTDNSVITTGISELAAYVKSFSLTHPATGTITVDMAARTITLDGIAHVVPVGDFVYRLLPGNVHEFGIGQILVQVVE